MIAKWENSGMWPKMGSFKTQGFWGSLLYVLLTQASQSCLCLIILAYSIFTEWYFLCHQYIVDKGAQAGSTIFVIIYSLLSSSCNCTNLCHRVSYHINMVNHTEHFLNIKFCKVFADLQAHQVLNVDVMRLYKRKTTHFSSLPPLNFFPSFLLSTASTTPPHIPAV